MLVGIPFFSGFPVHRLKFQRKLVDDRFTQFLDFISLDLTKLSKQFVNFRLRGFIP